MKQIKLGVLGNTSRRKRARSMIKKIVPIFLVVAILMAVAICLTTLSGSSTVVDLILSGTSLRSSEGKVNILLLGIAGGAHDGANLTDTIVVLSYNLKTNEAYLISVPRDLWLPSLRAKANAVYEIGRSQNNGLGLSKTVMGNIVGLPIHYVLRVDFRGFIKAIDLLGGVDVLVDRSFDDYNYPIEGRGNDMCDWEEKEVDFSEEEAKKLNIDPGKRKVLVSLDGRIATDSAEPKKSAEYFSCRFEHLSFKFGQTHMDGETALKFVRSRTGTNGEGSDFARSKRQQKVLEALRTKALSLETFFNPQKLKDIFSELGKSIDTDISIKDGVEFYQLSKKLAKSHSFVLGKTTLFIQPNPADYGGAYVLISQDDDFSNIQNFVREILSGEALDEASASSWAR